MSWGQSWDGVYPRALVCCGWTCQAQHGQWTRVIQAAWKGKLRQGWLEDSRDSQLSPGHAQILSALWKVQPSASTPSASPPSPPPPLRQLGRAGQAAGTQYLHLHVPHVSKSLLLPLKMGLEGWGRDTGENKS